MDFKNSEDWKDKATAIAVVLLLYVLWIWAYVECT